jgi:hypothetical protein
MTMTETTPEPWHGTITGYYAKHCRCADCREAIRIHYHEVVKKDPPKPCQAEGCPKMAAPRRKWCHGHCRRMTKTGSVEGPAIRVIGGDDASYQAAHKRVLYARGKAKNYPCSHCGEPAKDWAYIHGSPREIPAGTGADGRAYGPYSPNPDDYQPMCAACHKDYDLERAGKAAARCHACGQRVRQAS